MNNTFMHMPAQAHPVHTANKPSRAHTPTMRGAYLLKQKRGIQYYYWLIVLAMAASTKLAGYTQACPQPGGFSLCSPARSNKHHPLPLRRLVLNGGLRAGCCNTTPARTAPLLSVSESHQACIAIARSGVTAVLWPAIAIVISWHQNSNQCSAA